MRIRRRTNRPRRGKILVMTALMLPVFFGCALMSVDTAVLATAEAQLRTTADSAAAAAAMALVAELRLTGTTSLATTMSNARSAAIGVAKKNMVLNSPAVLLDNPTNSTSGDVVIGYIAPTDYTSDTPSTSLSPALDNSVMVRARRDATHGGQVPCFFGGPFGIGARDMAVSSTATVRNYSVRGLKTSNNANVDLLPFTLDKTTYDAMLGRILTADQFRFDTATGAVSSGSDGVPESQLFPVGAGSPGNFGTVNIGTSSNSTSVLEDQIRNGISPAQMATYPNGTLQLDTSLAPPSVNLSGNPGISAGMKDSLISQIGRTKVIPIYDQLTGNGSNSTYRIIAFAPVRIMGVNFSGSQKYLVVQPALLKDPALIPGPAQSSWTTGGAVRVFLSR